MASFISL